MREIVQFIRAVILANRRICGIENGSWRSSAEGDAAQAAVHIPPIVENCPAKRGPDVRQAHGKAKFLIENEQSLPADGKSGDAGRRYTIARAGLVQGEAAQGRAATREEAFGQ